MPSKAKVYVAVSVLAFGLLGGILTLGYGRTLFLEEVAARQPFLDVSNRQMALFLYDNPAFMRRAAKSKGTYLPAFSDDDYIHLKPEFADELAVCPPEVLYHYHVWAELVKDKLPVPEPDADLLDLFVADCPEWRGHPQQAQAFRGWKHFFIDQEEINRFQFCQADLEALWAKAPTLDPCYWKWLIPNYVKNCQSDTIRINNGQTLVPAFIRVALFQELAWQKQHPSLIPPIVGP